LARSHMILIGVLTYFGALILPAGYFLSKHWRGVANRPMLIGIGLQFVSSLAVLPFVFYSWQADYSDYYYGWALLIPVNLASFMYFLAVLIFYAPKARNSIRTSVIRWLSGIVIGMAVVVLLYFVSYGPANSFVARGYLDPRKVDAFYRPLPERIQDMILGIWTKIDTRHGVGARV